MQKKWRINMAFFKKFLQEFKEFALRGNVMDLAIGVIIGAAFQAIINSLVNDVLSPLIGLVAQTDLSYLVLTLNGVDIKYGAFLTAVINFIIMVFVIFLLVKGMNALGSLGKKKKSRRHRPQKNAFTVSVRSTSTPQDAPTVLLSLY